MDIGRCIQWTIFRATFFLHWYLLLLPIWLVLVLHYCSFNNYYNKKTSWLAATWKKTVVFRLHWTFQAILNHPFGSWCHFANMKRQKSLGADVLCINTNFSFDYNLSFVWTHSFDGNAWFVRKILPVYFVLFKATLIVFHFCN